MPSLLLRPYLHQFHVTKLLQDIFTNGGTFLDDVPLCLMVALEKEKKVNQKPPL